MDEEMPPHVCACIQGGSCVCVDTRRHSSQMSRVCADKRGELYSRVMFGSVETDCSPRSPSRGASESLARSFAWKRTSKRGRRKRVDMVLRFGKQFRRSLFSVSLLLASTPAPFASIKEFLFLSLGKNWPGVDIFDTLLLASTVAAFVRRNSIISGVRIFCPYCAYGLDMFFVISTAPPLAPIKDFEYIQIAFCVVLVPFCRWPFHMLLFVSMAAPSVSTK